MGHAFIATGEMREDAPARRIGQRRERAIEGLLIIFNHMVKYIARQFAMQQEFSAGLTDQPIANKQAIA